MSRRTVLAGIAAIFAAMLGRMGWVDWMAVLEGAAFLTGALLLAAVLASFFIGIPMFLMWSVIRAVIWLLVPGKPATRPRPGRPAGNRPQ